MFIAVWYCKKKKKTCLVFIKTAAQTFTRPATWQVDSPADINCDSQP